MIHSPRRVIPPKTIFENVILNVYPLVRSIFILSVPTYCIMVISFMALVVWVKPYFFYVQKCGPCFFKNRTRTNYRKFDSIVYRWCRVYRMSKSHVIGRIERKSWISIPIQFDLSIVSTSKTIHTFNSNISVHISVS